jgi:Zn2+/Cd2+-exporting ATPase
LIQPVVAQWSSDLEAVAQQLEQTGKTVIWVAHAGQLLGLMAIADTSNKTLSLPSV